MTPLRKITRRIAPALAATALAGCVAIPEIDAPDPGTAPAAYPALMPLDDLLAAPDDAARDAEAARDDAFAARLAALRARAAALRRRDPEAR